MESKMGKKRAISCFTFSRNKNVEDVLNLLSSFRSKLLDKNLEHQATINGDAKMQF